MRGSSPSLASFPPRRDDLTALLRVGVLWRPSLFFFLWPGLSPDDWRERWASSLYRLGSGPKSRRRPRVRSRDRVRISLRDAASLPSIPSASHALATASFPDSGLGYVWRLCIPPMMSLYAWMNSGRYSPFVNIASSPSSGGSSSSAAPILHALYRSSISTSVVRSMMSCASVAMMSRVPITDPLEFPLVWSVEPEPVERTETSSS